MADLSAKVVLNNCDRLEKDRVIWALIIPYLNLRDLNALTGPSDRMLNIIQWGLARGSTLVIDGESLAVSSHCRCRLVPLATTITLVAIPEPYLNASCLPFSESLHSLTITDTTVWSSSIFNLPTLSHFTLINVTIERRLLDSWLARMDRLRYLVINNVKTWFSRTLCIDLNNCDTLRHLSIKSTAVRLEEPYHLTSLKLSGKANFISFRFKYYEDIHLFFPSWWSLFHLGKLKSLTLHTWCEVRLPRHLEHLKIHQAIDLQLKEKIAQLSIKSVEVDFYEYATEDQENLIVNKLDRDCLLIIAELLGQKDRLAFAQSHPSIGAVVFQYGFPSLEIHSKINENYEPVFPFLRQLTVNQDKGLHAIPLCTNLKSLSISDSLSVELVSLFPTRLERLDISFTKPSENDPNLEVALARYFGQLSGIIEISFNDLIPIPCMMMFLESNKDTLRSFRLKKMRPDADNEDLWRLLGTCPHLKELKLFLEDYDNVTLKYLPLVGERLLKLTVNNIDETDILFGQYFPQLQELQVSLWTNCFESIETITTLRKLKVESCCDDFTDGWEPDIFHSEAQVLHLISALSNLQELHLPHFDPSTAFDERVAKYLQERGRDLRFQSLCFVGIYSDVM